MNNRLRWLSTARSNQLTPQGDWWDIWLLNAGRGYGKTRSGAEDAAWFGIENAQSRIAVVAKTFADARDTCIEGESGMLACLPPSWVRAWNRSLGELVLTNGTVYKLFSSDAPSRLRGPQHHRAWIDELASWESFDAFDQVMFGLRLGRRPRAVITTTPRPVAVIRELMQRVGRDVAMSTGSTYDNIVNLPESFLRRLRERYEGTRLADQELHAKLLNDVPGALWRYDFIQRWPQGEELPSMDRIVVAVDPAVTSNANSDETGIIVAGRIANTHPLQGIILEDGSLKGTPNEWGHRVINLHRKWKADRVIAEVNNGGDLVTQNLRSIDGNVPVTTVHASRGKLTRAEPVSAMYEQRRIWHATRFVALEEQMTTYDGSRTMKSPDRMDAMVWAINDLLMRKGAFVL